MELVLELEEADEAISELWWLLLEELHSSLCCKFAILDLTHVAGVGVQSWLVCAAEHDDGNTAYASGPGDFIFNDFLRVLNVSFLIE
jgi:hypothetical protein